MKACVDGEIMLMTDRAAFFGRQHTFGVPSCMTETRVEKDVARAVGIMCSVSVPGKQVQNVTFAIAAGDNMSTVSQCLSGISGEEDAKRIVQLAWTHSQVEMRYQKLKDKQANLFQKIASRTVITIPPVYPDTGEPKDVCALWSFGLSGDVPIICLFAHDIDHVKTVRMLAAAQSFMHLRHVNADLVIIYDGGGEYLCPLRDQIIELAQAASGRACNRIFPLSRKHLDEADVATILHASCLVLEDNVPLEKQLTVDRQLRPLTVFEQIDPSEMACLPKVAKVFENGRGGFVGNEYCIDVTDTAPLPWSNILANERFGSLISAGGGGYTWAGNARMNRLTPFRNDALTDVAGEGVIVRNDRTGEIFSIAPDAYAAGPYRIIHGFGYTEFERYGGIDAHTAFFVDSQLPVKAGLVRLTNNTGREDTFSVYYYAETSLNDTVCQRVTAAFDNNMLFGMVPLKDRENMMFIAMPGQDVHYTASAYEFFGMPGNNILPESAKTQQLSDSAGAGRFAAGAAGGGDSGAGRNGGDTAFDGIRQQAGNSEYYGGFWRCAKHRGAAEADQSGLASARPWHQRHDAAQVF